MRYLVFRKKNESLLISLVRFLCIVDFEYRQNCWNSFQSFNKDAMQPHKPAINFGIFCVLFFAFLDHNYCECSFLSLLCSLISIDSLKTWTKLTILSTNWLFAQVFVIVRRWKRCSSKCFSPDSRTEKSS